MKALWRIGFGVVCGLLILGTASAQYDNSPSNLIILPEAIWAPATGGGEWVTFVQITNFTAGTNVSVYFIYPGGERGPISLFTDLPTYQSRGYANMLQSLQTLDSGFTYYGRVGALEFRTQSADHKIQVQARTINGNYGKTMQGLRNVDSNTLRYHSTDRRTGVIQNLTSNATYRTFVGFYNFSSSSVTIQFIIVRHNNTTAGVSFSKTIPAMGYISFNPFVEAGVPYPANSFTNCWLYINPTSGGGRVFGFGSSANNHTNDTYAHTMVQFE